MSKTKPRLDLKPPSLPPEGRTGTAPAAFAPEIHAPALAFAAAAATDSGPDGSGEVNPFIANATDGNTILTGSARVSAVLAARTPAPADPRSPATHITLVSAPAPAPVKALAPAPTSAVPKAPSPASSIMATAPRHGTAASVSLLRSPTPTSHRSVHIASLTNENLGGTGDARKAELTTTKMILAATKEAVPLLTAQNISVTDIVPVSASQALAPTPSPLKPPAVASAVETKPQAPPSAQLRATSKIPHRNISAIAAMPYFSPGRAPVHKLPPEPSSGLATAALKGFGASSLQKVCQSSATPFAVFPQNVSDASDEVGVADRSHATNIAGASSTVIDDDKVIAESSSAMGDANVACASAMAVDNATSGASLASAQITAPNFALTCAPLPEPKTALSPSRATEHGPAYAPFTTPARAANHTSASTTALDVPLPMLSPFAAVAPGPKDATSTTLCLATLSRATQQVDIALAAIAAKKFWVGNTMAQLVDGLASASFEGAAGLDIAAAAVVLVDALGLSVAAAGDAKFTARAAAERARGEKVLAAASSEGFLDMLRSLNAAAEEALAESAALAEEASLASSKGDR